MAGSPKLATGPQRCRDRDQRSSQAADGAFLSFSASQKACRDIPPREDEQQGGGYVSKRMVGGSEKIRVLAFHTFRGAEDRSLAGFRRAATFFRGDI